jgi:hypothetical protein
MGSFRGSRRARGPVPPAARPSAPPKPPAPGRSIADQLKCQGNGLKVMENILRAQKKIDAVYTHDAGRDNEMFLTGVGGSQDAMKQIEEGGLYRATFLYNPNMAATAVNMARLIALDQESPSLSPW